MTDARAGKVVEKVLVSPNPNAQAGSVALKALSSPNPAARAGSVALKALARQVIPGTLAATGVVGTAALTGTYTEPIYDTDLSNVAFARIRSGVGLVTVEVPVAPVPPGTTRASRYDKAVALPAPTMVDGRPT